MDDNFFNKLYSRQQKAQAVPSNKEIATWAFRLLGSLFPETSDKVFTSAEALKEEFNGIQAQLFQLLEQTQACVACDNKFIAAEFMCSAEVIFEVLKTDVSALTSGDPAASNEYEVIRTYPGFMAIAFYRIAHQLHLLNVPLVPRILTEYAHSRTGIDIHPAANIGTYLCIDHGTGIVIGETADIGDHVKLYQGVTLGALSVSKDLAGIKRHPTVQNNVVIYSNATILGGDTVIGAHSIIGGNVWITKSVQTNSTVYHTPIIKVIDNSSLNIL